MRIPKRLPEGLKSLVELTEVFDRPMLLSATMERRKGAVEFQMTYIARDFFKGEVLITLDSLLLYNKYERRIEEHESEHRRSVDTFRKAVLAS